VQLDPFEGFIVPLRMIHDFVEDDRAIEDAAFF
jgi:hypothetical protein